MCVSLRLRCAASSAQTAYIDEVLIYPFNQITSSSIGSSSKLHYTHTCTHTRTHARSHTGVVSSTGSAQPVSSSAGQAPKSSSSGGQASSPCNALACVLCQPTLCCSFDRQQLSQIVDREQLHAVIHWQRLCKIIYGQQLKPLVYRWQLCKVVDRAVSRYTLCSDLH